jgi:hypothetical protein
MLSSRSSRSWRIWVSSMACVGVMVWGIIKKATVVVLCEFLMNSGQV